jgi:hypothetical protein
MFVSCSYTHLSNLKCCPISMRSDYKLLVLSCRKSYIHVFLYLVPECNDKLQTFACNISHTTTIGSRERLTCDSIASSIYRTGLIIVHQTPHYVEKTRNSCLWSTIIEAYLGRGSTHAIDIFL